MKLSFDVSDTEDKMFSSEYCPGALYYRDRPFESGCFCNRTLEVLDWEADDFPALFSEFLKAENIARGDLLYLRLPAEDISAIQAAEQAGFYFIENSIIPFIRLKRWKRSQYQRYIVPMKRVGADDIEEVEAIAKETFRGLRFNIDPHIGNEQADIRYYKWLRNAYENGEDIEAIMHHDKIAGFSLLRHEANAKTVFRLAGMRPDLKNAGLGLTLYASTTAYCQDLGVTHIDGGISMANCPVLNVMASLGYSFKDPTMVFHYYAI